MTPHQRELARHALGLPNDGKRSYRNRFFAGQGHADYADWIGLVSEGLANNVATSGDLIQFWLTKAGAAAALMPGETLDPEDFA